MKYGSKWKENIKQLPPYLQTSSISYKKWKKIAKSNTTSSASTPPASTPPSSSPHCILQALVQECQRVDSTIARHLQPKHRSILCFSACQTVQTPMHPMDVYNFAKINKMKHLQPFI